MSEQSVSFHSLYEWIKQSNEVSWKIIHLIQARKQENEQSFEQSFEQSLDEETVKEIQDLLLYQVWFISYFSMNRCVLQASILLYYSINFQLLQVRIIILEDSLYYVLYYG